MATSLSFSQHVERFQENEPRVDTFVNGDENTTWTSSGGAVLPSIEKLIADADQEINDGAESILALATAQADISEGFALQSENSADIALAAKNSAIALATMRASKEIALADTTIADQAFFSTPSTVAGEAALIYQKVSGSAIYKATLISAEYVTSKLGTNSNINGTAFTNADGFVYFNAFRDGRVLTNTFDSDRRQIDVVINSSIPGVQFKNADDFVYAHLKPGGNLIGDVADPTARTTASQALTIAEGARVKTGRTILLGDSRTEQVSIAPTLYFATRLSDFGHFTWANFLLKGKLDLVYNGGIGGDTTAAALARTPSILSTYSQSADIFVVSLGINDVLGGVPLSTTTANLQEICNQGTAKGLTVVLCTITSLGSTNASLTATNFTAICNLNSWIKRYTATNKNIVLCDYSKATIDPLSATGATKANYLQSDDQIHEAPLGAKAEGEILAAVLDPLVPDISILPISIANNWNLSNGGNQLFGNPLVQGTGGTNSNPGVISGVVPTDFTLSTSGTWPLASVVSSTAARSDGYGNDWQIQVNSTNTNSVLFFGISDISSRVQLNNILDFVSSLEVINAVNLMGLRLFVYSVVNGVTTYSSLFEFLDYQPTLPGNPDTPWTPNMYPQGSYSGALKAPGLVLPSSGTITTVRAVITARFGGVGSAIFKLGRVAINKR